MSKLKPAVPSTPHHMCAYDCVQLRYTVQQWTVLISFPLILQTIITAQITSRGYLSIIETVCTAY